MSTLSIFLLYFKFLHHRCEMHLEFFDFVSRQSNSEFTEPVIGRRSCPLSDLKTFDSSEFANENFPNFWSFFHGSIFFERIISCIDRLDDSVELFRLCMIEGQ